ARLSSALADWLGGAFVIDSLASGLVLRGRLAPGAVLVTRDGRLLTRHTLTYHAPDSELHGVLSRQREIESLDGEVAVKKAALQALQSAVDDQAALIADAKSELAVLRQDVAGLQQRHHALQVDSV